MDPRLNWVKSAPATGSAVEIGSPVQDPRKRSTAGCSDTGTGSSTPVPSRNSGQTPPLSQSDAISLEKAFLNLGTRSGNSSIYRRKRDYLRARSQTAAEELSRTEQTAALFPFIVEQARQSQKKIDSDLERTEKSVRDSSAAEKTAAQDLVRLQFDIISRVNPKTISQESQVDTLIREIQGLRDIQTSVIRRAHENDAKLAALVAENEQLKSETAALKHDISQLQSHPVPDPLPWADSLDALRREIKDHVSEIKNRMKPLQGLPKNLDQIRSKLTIQEASATQTAQAFDSKLERLETEISKMDTLRLEPKEDVSEIKDIMKPLQDLPEISDQLRREYKDRISPLEDRIKLLEQLPDSLDQFRSHLATQEGNAIKAAKLFSSKVDGLAREMSKKGSHLAIMGLKNQFLAFEKRFEVAAQTHNQKSYQEEKNSLQELRQMLQALKQEKDTQLEESHNIIMSDMQRIERANHEMMDELQDQVQALKELCGKFTPSTEVSTEEHGEPNAFPLSQRMKEVESKVETLRAELSNQEKLLNDRLLSLNSGENEETSLTCKQVETEHGKALSALSQSIDIQLETHKNQIADLDRNLTTLMRAQMSSDDREALQTLRTLSRRMEKQEHQHQWLRTRFDNLSTESLHRQMIGYIAPVLPKLEQGLRKIDLGMENLEKRVTQLSNKLEASVSDVDSRIQLVEDNLAGYISRSQEQHEALAEEFRETRDVMVPKLKDLDSLFEELKRKLQQITGQQAESIQNSTEAPSTPRNMNVTSPAKALPRTRSRPKPSQSIKSPQPGPSQQKAAIGDWIDSSSSGDELDLSHNDETNDGDLDSTALLNMFKKPIDREASTRSNRPLTQSTRSSPAAARQTAMENTSGYRKRKRSKVSFAGDIEHVESGEDMIRPPRKGVHGK
ncbi:uncharacterized protein A1O9_01506 [Exophiala aquamarina CBS 119918]|uniref:Uncharacterized protein n=1 Tax=Exophiala aquamarina CBS 119918 TaxID=1182545 RepID=A0A072PVZ5_9EURO|nr:uncharacterized protein A1O9_01506 [Exophiala aquamarina CBS 119918]KEF63528.1 hypothetical protein A1O9_01506 [Exophiala aquamarina CBS 119918]